MFGLWRSQNPLCIKGDPIAGNSINRELISKRIFETRTAIGREDFTCENSGVSQIFVLIISNGEKIHSNVNVVV